MPEAIEQTPVVGAIAQAALFGTVSSAAPEIKPATIKALRPILKKGPKLRRHRHVAFASKPQVRFIKARSTAVSQTILQPAIIATVHALKPKTSVITPGQSSRIMDILYTLGKILTAPFWASLWVINTIFHEIFGSSFSSPSTVVTSKAAEITPETQGSISTNPRRNRRTPPLSLIDTVRFGADGKPISAHIQTEVYKDAEILAVHSIEKTTKIGQIPVSYSKHGKAIIQQQAVRGCTAAASAMLIADHKKTGCNLEYVR